MSDTLGARLRQAREQRHLTLLQASETTKVRTHYLQALESDDYSAMPSAAQARGFLRIYAEFLGLDLTDVTHTIQPAPAPASVEPVAAPESTKTSRPSLFAGLRDRLARRQEKDAEMASVPTELPAEPTELPAAQPASPDAQTTRPTKAASEEVKKNAIQ